MDKQKTKIDKAQAEWDAAAKRTLKAELARKGVSYKVLVDRLERIGVKDSAAAVASRISRGRFTFAFFLQCMHVLGVKDLRIETDKKSWDT